jgi:proprotein convertase subtilisin/kexin type 5
LTCDNTGSCLSCSSAVDFRTLSATTGRCIPLGGYFENGAQVAGKCSAECQQCSSPTVCTSCAAGYYLFNSNCISSCPTRYSSNATERVCKPCPSDCLTCDTNGNCLSCSASENRILSVSAGRCVPMAGYYDNKGALVAVACPSRCLACSSASQCSSCSSGSFLNPGGNCSTTCPARYVQNFQANIC